MVLCHVKIISCGEFGNDETLPRILRSVLVKFPDSGPPGPTRKATPTALRLRRHHLGKLTPIEFETINMALNAA